MTSRKHHFTAALPDLFVPFTQIIRTITCMFSSQYAFIFILHHPNKERRSPRELHLSASLHMSYPPRSDQPTCCNMDRPSQARPGLCGCGLSWWNRLSATGTIRLRSYTFFRFLPLSMIETAIHCSREDLAHSHCYHAYPWLKWKHDVGTYLMRLEFTWTTASIIDRSGCHSISSQIQVIWCDKRAGMLHILSLQHDTTHL